MDRILKISAYSSLLLFFLSFFNLFFGAFGTYNNDLFALKSQFYILLLTALLSSIIFYGYKIVGEYIDSKFLYFFSLILSIFFVLEFFYIFYKTYFSLGVFYFDKIDFFLNLIFKIIFSFFGMIVLYYIFGFYGFFTIFLLFFSSILFFLNFFLNTPIIGILAYVFLSLFYLSNSILLFKSVKELM